MVYDALDFHHLAYITLYGCDPFRIQCESRLPNSCNAHISIVKDHPRCRQHVIIVVYADMLIAMKCESKNSEHSVRSDAITYNISVNFGPPPSPINRGFQMIWSKYCALVAEHDLHNGFVCAKMVGAVAAEFNTCFFLYAAVVTSIYAY